MNAHDSTYLKAVSEILERGAVTEDRTGVGTIELFGMQCRYPLKDAFPLLTSKAVFWKGIVHELVWLMRGETNIKYLVDNNVHIWDEWADENGDLGPVYGRQWRDWFICKEVNGGLGMPSGPGVSHDPLNEEFYVDQLQHAIETLKTNPDSRRIIVSSWNVGELNDMALPPCHTLFQFHSQVMSGRERMEYASEFMKRELDCTTDCALAGEVDCRNTICDKLGIPRRKLSLQLYQRSGDMFLGVPFNVASYSLLTHIVAKLTGHAVGDFVHTLGSAHIYQNHMDQVKEQLSRVHIAPKSPRIDLSDFDSIDAFTADHVRLVGYHPLPAIKAPVAV